MDGGAEGPGSVKKPSLPPEYPKTNPDVCIRCATCTAVCPVARVTPRFPGPKQAGPGADRFRQPQDPSVDDWIDLCLGCHLCDTVCSAGVNASEMNLLAKAKRAEEKGMPLRDWLLTRLFRINILASVLCWIANPLMINRPFRWLLDALLGVDRRRDLPAYQTPSFRRWFRFHPPAKGPKVAYFYGCFTNVHEVEVGKATVDVLEANGFEVVLPPQDCCGIPLLGIGDLRGASRMGNKNISTLLASVRQGMDVVFTSTSCGLMIRHEYSRTLQLPRAEELAARVFECGEFLRRLHTEGRLNTRFRRMPLRAAYFAPCHLRALDIGLPALELLRLIPGMQVLPVDVHCCGLAGLYGFRKEKFEISEEIGSDLGEAILALKPEVAVTECEGCRMQIRHLTGLPAVHPVMLLRDALKGM